MVCILENLGLIEPGFSQRGRFGSLFFLSVMFFFYMLRGEEKPNQKLRNEGTIGV